MKLAALGPLSGRPRQIGSSDHGGRRQCGRYPRTNQPTAACRSRGWGCAACWGDASVVLVDDGGFLTGDLVAPAASLEPALSVDAVVTLATAPAASTPLAPRTARFIVTSRLVWLRLRTPGPRRVRHVSSVVAFGGAWHACQKSRQGCLAAHRGRAGSRRTHRRSDGVQISARGGWELGSWRQARRYPRLVANLKPRPTLHRRRSRSEAPHRQAQTPARKSFPHARQSA